MIPYCRWQSLDFLCSITYDRNMFVIVISISIIIIIRIIIISIIIIIEALVAYDRHMDGCCGACLFLINYDNCLSVGIQVFRICFWRVCDFRCLDFGVWIWDLRIWDFCFFEHIFVQHKGLRSKPKHAQHAGAWTKARTS